jgi:prolyl-tRNA synthetase
LLFVHDDGFECSILIVLQGMRWSTLFIPTLREPQAHQLLERAGYIREVSHRNFAYLPLAQRSLLKIQHIVRAEMNAIGGQEIRLPLSGGSSAEEMVKAIAKAELRSHKQLPQVWYQIQAGAADSFVFGADASGLAAAHQRICGRCGLECSAIETGLVIYSAAGESLVARCGQCDYGADLAFAVSKASDTGPDPDGDLAPEEFFTPGSKTIAAIADFTKLPETSQMKSLVFVADWVPVLAMLRGDHQLSETKLRGILGAKELRPAQAREIVEWFGAGAGSLGPVGVKNMRIVADLALKGRRNMIAGANKDDYHLKNVTPGEDFHPEYFDLRQVVSGDRCARCSGAIRTERAVEIAHASANSYRLDLDRVLSSVAELCSDKDGLRLSPAIAPFDAVITPVNYAEPTQQAAADRIYSECLRAGIDVVLDDREERPGVKFKDADLVGIPYRITIGKKLSDGLVELTDRQTRAVEDVRLESIVSRLNIQSAAARF